MYAFGDRQGTFDDCQAIVKEAFQDVAFRNKVGISDVLARFSVCLPLGRKALSTRIHRHPLRPPTVLFLHPRPVSHLSRRGVLSLSPFVQVRLGAVNSINWARVLAQITYYFHAYLSVTSRDKNLKRVSFSVPTGNFGDVLAGYYAKHMGLPIDKLIVATNSNDILHRFFTSGKYWKKPIHRTLSPSMDITISSNFERLLFDLADRTSPCHHSKRQPVACGLL